MPGALDHARTLVDRLGDVVALELVVARASDPTPWLREVVLTGGLAGLDPLPGQDLMVSIDDDGRHRWRRYTIRRLSGSELTLWVTPHTGGPGARWALDAAPGREVVCVGPRGKVRLDDAARAHLFVVDATGLAAAAAMIAALPRGATARCVATVPSDPGGLGLLSDAACDARVLLATEHDAPEVAAAAAAALEEPACYVLGERGVTHRVTEALREVTDAARVASKAYWRADRANLDHGEPGKDD